MLALLALLLPAPGGQAQSGPLTIDIEPGTAAQSFNVDLLAANVTSLVFRLDEADYPTLAIDAVIVRLTKGSEELQVPMQSPEAIGSGTSWVGTLAKSDRDLTRGTHAVTVQIITPTGDRPLDARSRSIVVAAADSVAPMLGVSQESSDGRLFLGPGEEASVLVNDASPSSGLRRVSYRLPTTSTAIALEFPYTIGATSFAEGTQDLTLAAVDRAGNVATKVVRVTVDSAAPTLEVTLPERLFVGVPAVVLAKASDANAYDITLQQGATTSVLRGTGPQTTHSFPLLVDEEGRVDLTLRAVDAIGNAVERRASLNATILQSDTTIRSMSIVPERPVAGDKLTLHVLVVQDPGFAPLDVNVTLSGAVASEHLVPVPVSTPGDLAVPIALPAGRHQVSALVGAPAGVNETDPGNQFGTLEFEVFYGKLEDGATTYYISAGPTGLPAQAIGPDNAAYPLTLVQEGSVVAYEFQAGGKTLSWQPFGDGQSGSSSATGGAKGSPGPAVPLLALAVLALAVALRRR